MVKYREILGLHAPGSALAILLFSCRCSTATVRAATDRAKAAALEWPLPEKMGDRAIGEVVFPNNLEQGVVKHAVDEFVINEQYRRMTEYYGYAVVSGRPPIWCPQDKGVRDTRWGPNSLAQELPSCRVS